MRLHSTGERVVVAGGKGDLHVYAPEREDDGAMSTTRSRDPRRDRTSCRLPVFFGRCTEPDGVHRPSGGIPCNVHVRRMVEVPFSSSVPENEPSSGAATSICSAFRR